MVTYDKNVVKWLFKQTVEQNITTRVLLNNHGHNVLTQKIKVETKLWCR